MQPLELESGQPSDNQLSRQSGQQSNQHSLDLGIIGNCQISALIDRQARYVWTCLPRLDGDPIFCSLLRNDAADDLQGIFNVELQGASKFEQSYERNTAVLETV